MSLALQANPHRQQFEKRPDREALRRHIAQHPDLTQKRDSRQRGKSPGWMPKGDQVEVMTPEINEKHYLAGALNLTTGTITHCVWYRKQTRLFLDLLETLDRTHPAPLFTHLTVVVDSAQLHKAKRVQ